MNNLRQLILSYNRFIDDLKRMNDDLMNEIDDRTGLELIGQYWQPRDRSAWSPKNRFYASYKSSDNQFLINTGFLLDQSMPSFFISRVDFKTEDIEKNRLNLNQYCSDWWATQFWESNELDQEEQGVFIIYKCPEDWEPKQFTLCKISLECIKSRAVLIDSIIPILEMFVNGNFPENYQCDDILFTQ